jgi:protein O-GlcNAc transferase
MLSAGIEHQRAGRFHEAEVLFRQLIAQHPDCAQAWDGLGMIAHEAKCFDAAATHVEKAIVLQPNCAAFHNSLGIVRTSIGQPQRAVESFRTAVNLEPEYAEAHNNLGATLNTLGRGDEAVKCFANATRILPKALPFQLNLARTLQFLGRHNEALIAFQKILNDHPTNTEARLYYSQVLGQIGKVVEQVRELRFVLGQVPNNADAHNELGLAFARQGQLQEALKSFSAAIKNRVGFSDAHNNLGKVFVRLGQFREAELEFLRSVRSNPKNADAHLQLGLLDRMRGNSGEAAFSFNLAIEVDAKNADCRVALARLLAAEGKPRQALESYRIAFSLAPADPLIGIELGNQLQELGMYDEAGQTYAQVVHRHPQHPLANTTYAQLLADQGHLSKAVRHVEIAQRQIDTPRLRILKGTLLPPIYESMDHIRATREALARNLSELNESGARIDVNENLLPTLFYLAYQGLNDREFAEALSKLATNYETHLPSPEDFSPSNKIHVAFISRNFSNHTIGGLNVGLVEKLSRELFDVTVFSIGQYNDEIGQRFQRAADHFITLPTNVTSAVRTISQAKPDILFYTDIGMDPFCYSLSFARLAPVQCVTWGHPVTTGLPAMDYFISSTHLETPESDNQYTEQLIRLSRLAVYYEKPQLKLPLRDRTAFGLPQTGTLYSCPQTLFKFHPEFDAMIGAILQGDPGSSLVLIEGKYPEWKDTLLKRFRRAIPDIAERIIFVPRQTRPQFLNLIAISDVMLDPIHFGGGNTSYEGLAFGVPIVTLPSAMLRGRITYALYQQMQFTDLIATDPADYVRIAIDLGLNANKRKQASQTILQKNHVLFEDIEGVRELEKFFLDTMSKLRASKVGK